MLIACKSCHRQYDVGDFAVGTKVRCLCSEPLVVPHVQPRELQMQRCAACGGELAAGATQCGYCGSGVQLSERGYGGTCPECFARLVKDAQYCSTCGTGIAPVGTVQALQGRPCPRCETELVVQEFATGSLIECPSCGGLWLDEAVFLDIIKQRDQHAVAQLVSGRSPGPVPAPELERTVRYLKCPTCAEPMHRKNFAQASGVVIDWCRGHGYWFDCHELEQILQFAAGGGMDAARRRELERHQTEVRRLERQARAAKAESHGPFAPMDVETTGIWVLVDLVGKLFTR
ncbi:MAG: zf-TFIIB domain-containing protein [Planctomycetes bacterium]|nr:zf-TFIIB domain-containing protein [Planctomycetota bacterium]